MLSTLLDPPYDDDDGDAVVVDNDVDGDARWYDCLEIVWSHKKGPLLWLLYFEYKNKIMWLSSQRSKNLDF